MSDNHCPECKTPLDEVPFYDCRRAEMEGNIFFVREDIAITPADGMCITNRWWAFHPEKGLAFYYVADGFYGTPEPCPQCNNDESTARKLIADLLPDLQVKFVPVVFLAHARRIARQH